MHSSWEWYGPSYIHMSMMATEGAAIRVLHLGSQSWGGGDVRPPRGFVTTRSAAKLPIERSCRRRVRRPRLSARGPPRGRPSESSPGMPESGGGVRPPRGFVTTRSAAAKLPIGAMRRVEGNSRRVRRPRLSARGAAIRVLPQVAEFGEI